MLNCSLAADMRQELMALISASALVPETAGARTASGTEVAEYYSTYLSDRSLWVVRGGAYFVGVAIRIQDR